MNLSFGASGEAWLCRGFSALATLALIALFANTKRGKNPVQNFIGIHRARGIALNG